jgi:hypothetical protein
MMTNHKHDSPGMVILLLLSLLLLIESGSFNPIRYKGPCADVSFCPPEYPSPSPAANHTSGHGMTNSLDQFNNEDIAEFGDDGPVRPSDRGLILDRLFNSRKVLPSGNSAAGDVGEGHAVISSMYDGLTAYGGRSASSGSFNIMRGDDVWTGLNYGNNREWGTMMQSGMQAGRGYYYGSPNSGAYDPFSSDAGYAGPYAGPPMFIVPAKPVTTTAVPGSTDASATTAAPGAEGNDSVTTMKPEEKVNALVHAFGGGEKPRLQQMGPPIIVPMGSVPGLKGVGGMSQAPPRQLAPGERPPMFGRIILGPPKWAQAVDMSAGASRQRYNSNQGGLTLVRYNKPVTGIQYGNQNMRSDAFQTSSQRDAQAARRGFRSLEPFDDRANGAARPPPVIKYVPVVETVRRKRMKAVLAEPV